MRAIERVGVIGAGTMGNGIAQACAVAGIDVVMIDVAHDAVVRGVATIEASLGRLQKKDRITAEAARAALARVHGATDYAELESAGLIVEAATETLDLKLRILKRADEIAGAGTILASNTSSISITALAAVVRAPDRFLGMHFFNPVPMMALVELIRGLQTSEATVAAARGFAERLGKTPIVVKNSPGFAVNRILCPMIN